MKLRAGVLLVALATLIDSPLKGLTRAGSPLKGLTTSEGLASGAQRTQRLSIRTEDGVSVAAMWYEPSHRPAPAVVLVHMLTRSRREWDPVASQLAFDGIGALAIDLRGHGDSSGDAGNLAAMVNDVKAAKRHLAVRPDVIHSRIGMAGASLGANLAVLAAADDPGVVSLVLLSPSLDYRGLRIEAALRKYGKRPALLVAGRDDGYAVRSVKDLAAGGGGLREALLLDGGGHGTMMFGRAPELGRQVVEWFRRTLQ